MFLICRPAGPDARSVGFTLCDNLRFAHPAGRVTENRFNSGEGGCLTSNDRAIRRFGLRKILRNLDLAAKLGVSTFVMWSGRGGSHQQRHPDYAETLRNQVGVTEL